MEPNKQDPKFNGKFPLGMLIPDRFNPSSVNVVVQPGESVHYALFEKLILQSLKIIIESGEEPSHSEILELIPACFGLSTAILDGYNERLQEYQKQTPATPSSILTKS